MPREDCRPAALWLQVPALWTRGSCSLRRVLSGLFHRTKLPQDAQARLTGGLHFAYWQLILPPPAGFRGASPRRNGNLRYLFEDYTLDAERREMHRGADIVPVAPQVFDLLEYLIRNRERVVSK